MKVLLEKIIILLVIMLFVQSGSSCGPGQVDVFGMCWDSFTGGGSEYYTINNPNSVTFGCSVLAGYAAIDTPLTLSVGDVLSYDRYITESGWLGDYRSRPLTAAFGTTGNEWFEHTYRELPAAAGVAKVNQ